MSDFEAPQSRNEAILQNMLGATNTLQPPQSRIEALLQEMLESGSLPAVTTDDIGASLSVTRKAALGDTIIPVQTITLQPGVWTDVALAGTIYSEVRARPIMVVYDGVSYGTSFFMDDDDVYVANIYEESTQLEIYITVNTSAHTTTVNAYATTGTTHTIGVMATGYAAEWIIDPYPGYDIVIGADEHVDNVSHYTPIKYDWETIKRKVLAGEPVTGFIYTHWNYDDAVQGDTNGDIIPLDDVEIMSGSARLVFSRAKVLSKSGTSGVMLFLDCVRFNLDMTTGAPLSIPLFIHTSKTLA